MNKRQELLHQYFGYTSFREGQEDIIDAILSGRDALGIMPTGSGKSICFQLPALLLPGITLVVSPLISLMKDQVNALVQNGIRGAFLNSSLTPSQYRTALQNARRGVYKIIYVAPERLFTPEFQSFVQEQTISMVTVDEAHCVSQWGQDFRPSYLQIATFIRSFSKRPIVSAFTATATPKVREDILTLLELENPLFLLTGFNRPNLYFEVRKPKDKLPEVFSILQSQKGKSGIIYCSTRKSVEAVCRELTAKGYRATRYHAGLSEEERRKNQDDFLFDRSTVMVATNAFGMGIDKGNVSFVIHYNMPKDLESYYQEAGRAGRDGTDAACILLYSGQDVITNQFLLSNAEENQSLDPETQQLVMRQAAERLKSMTFYCHTTECFRQYMLRYFGERTQPYCGNCSNCLQHFITLDITREAKEILNCVISLRGRFGASIVCGILRGSKNQKVLQFTNLPQYGKLSKCSESFVRNAIQALCMEHFLEQTTGTYSLLVPGKRADRLLREDAHIKVKIPEEREVIKKKPTPGKSTLESVNPQLFQQLRKLRNSLAQKQHIPDYIVFSNATLEDMCRKLPETEEEFMLVSGVGKAKLQAYGPSFLEEIRKWKAEQ